MKKTFTATIKGAQDSGGAFVVIPFDMEEVFGKKRVKVQASFDGEPYRGTITPMGGQPLLIVVKKIREKIGKQAGDEVEVTVQEDTEPRVVEVPSAFQELLKSHPQAATFWQSLSYSHQREYAMWFSEAKRAETRERRINKAIEMLQEEKKRK